MDIVRHRTGLAACITIALGELCSAPGTPPSPIRVDGGTAPRLIFAVVGDTRPAEIDDTAGYPSAVIGTIYADIEAQRPRPAFVVATGDYVFASDGAGQARPQLEAYLAARQSYSGPLLPAMGNHECTGATASNCGPGTESGSSESYAAFLDVLMAPLGESLPYYAFRLAADDATWSAKVVVVAANAWSAQQAAWLDAALAQPTTYTFVVRHEPRSAITAPGVLPSEAVIARHPCTLLLVGHSHTYARHAGTPTEVVVGNGGAPLAGKSYGFALISRRADGAVAVDMLDFESRLADPAFHFAVAPDGSAAR
jgi:hypothetical protein